LLDRIEDPKTHRMKDLEVEIPETAYEEAKIAVDIIGDDMYNEFRLLPGCDPISKDNLVEMYLNLNWRPCMAVTGADGLPPLSKAGNVVRSSTSLRIKVRLPPTLDAKKAAEDCERILTENSPFGAKVEVQELITGGGWCMKDLKEKTKSSIEGISKDIFGEDYGTFGVGGSIPFLKTLEEKFVDTEIICLGVGGPETNIHAPNETINLPYLKKFICCLSHILSSLA
jgi:acetylornithine deacetylase/succinyl-diaminopimelate desuccinylase-like protein